LAQDALEEPDIRLDVIHDQDAGVWRADMWHLWRLHLRAVQCAIKRVIEQLEKLPDVDRFREVPYTTSREKTLNLAGGGVGADYDDRNVPRRAVAFEALKHSYPWISVDIGVFRANYWAEIARTFVVGAPTPEQTRLLDLVQQAQRAARKRLSVSHNVKNHALTPRASLVGREER
jgi:hypothetical protein